MKTHCSDVCHYIKLKDNQQSECSVSFNYTLRIAGIFALTEKRISTKHAIQGVHIGKGFTSVRGAHHYISFSFPSLLRIQNTLRMYTEPELQLFHPIRHYHHNH